MEFLFCQTGIANRISDLPLVVLVKQLLQQRPTRSLNLSKESKQNLSKPAGIKDLESFSETSRKASAQCVYISSYTHLGDQGLQAPWLLHGSMTSMKDCCLARLGEGLHFDKYSCVVTVSHTGVVVQVAKIPEGILDRVTEFYCCTTCGKVFWEGKHFAHAVHQFQHVLECARHHCIV